MRIGCKVVLVFRGRIDAIRMKKNEVDVNQIVREVVKPKISFAIRAFDFYPFGKKFFQLVAGIAFV
jgi:hypothetical protein